MHFRMKMKMNVIHLRCVFFPLELKTHKWGHTEKGIIMQHKCRELNSMHMNTKDNVTKLSTYRHAYQHIDRQTDELSSAHNKEQRNSTRTHANFDWIRKRWKQKPPISRSSTTTTTKINKKSENGLSPMGNDIHVICEFICVDLGKLTLVHVVQFKSVHMVKFSLPFRWNVNPLRG